MKPKQGHDDQGCETHSEISEQVSSEFEKEGRIAVLQKISSAARKAVSSCGDKAQSAQLPPALKALDAQVDRLLIDAMRATEWDDAKLARTAVEIGWAIVVMDVATLVSARDNDGGSTPANDCHAQYERCMEASGCNRSFFCICCIPCSLQYLGCMKRIIYGGLGVGGVYIA